MKEIDILKSKRNTITHAPFFIKENSDELSFYKRTPRDDLKISLQLYSEEKFRALFSEISQHIDQISQLSNDLLLSAHERSSESNLENILRSSRLGELLQDRYGSSPSIFSFLDED